MREKMLTGGCRPRSFHKITTLERVGGKAEGDVFAIDLKVCHFNRLRSVALVEKRFDADASLRRPDLPNFGSAEKQLAVIRKLRGALGNELAGFHMLPTVRLSERNGAKTLFMTRLDNVMQPALPYVGFLGFAIVEPLSDPLREVTPAEARDLNQRLWQIDRKLEKLGFKLGDDAFIFRRDPVSRAIELWLADFGSLREERRAGNP